jgi:hypothetical protein
MRSRDLKGTDIADSQGTTKPMNLPKNDRSPYMNVRASVHVMWKMFSSQFSSREQNLNSR